MIKYLLDANVWIYVIRRRRVDRDKELGMQEVAESERAAVRIAEAKPG